MKLFIPWIIVILLFIWVAPQVEAQEICKSIVWGASNGSFTKIDGNLPGDNFGNVADVSIGNNSGASQGTRGLFNITNFYDLNIPTTATCVAMNLTMTVESEFSATAVEDIVMHAVLETWNETNVSYEGFNNGGANGTQYNGSTNLITTITPSSPLDEEAFNWTMSTSYCQKLISKTLGDERFGLLFVDPISEQTPASPCCTSLHSDDSATADKIPRLTVCYTEAGETKPPVIDLVNLTSECTSPGCLGQLVNLSNPTCSLVAESSNCPADILGENTTTSPCLITNCEQLQNISLSLTGNYALQNDIDCIDSVDWLGGTGFVPLGDAFGNRFEGTFVGQYFTISNLYINRTETYTGLFGYVAFGSVVVNVKLVNATVTSTQSSVGSLCGLCGSSLGVINSSATNSTISGGSITGGLMGDVNSITVQNSFVENVIVRGSSQVGGLGGVTRGPSLVIDSFALNVTVNGTVKKIGGLIGDHVDSTINRTFSTGIVIGNNKSGGITGFTDDAKTTGGISIQNTFTTVEVFGNFSNGIAGDSINQLGAGGGEGGDNVISDGDEYYVNVYWFNHTTDNATACYGDVNGTGNFNCVFKNDLIDGIEYFYNVTVSPIVNWTFPPWNSSNNKTDYPFLNIINGNSAFDIPSAKCIVPRTNDTTPTFHINTTEDATCALNNDNVNFNYTDAITYNPNSECSTTGGTHHICTLTDDNATTGLRNFSVGCKDSDDNENLTSTSGKFLINITGEVTLVDLFLDSVGDSRKYEFRSNANISANITACADDTCQVCIDLDAPGYGFNFSCGTNFTSFIFNMTTLRTRNFSVGPSSVTFSSSDGVNITSNNKTQIVNVTINITSSGSTTNLNISFGSQVKKFFGDILSVYFIQDEFIESGSLKVAVNLTYTTAGSQFIFVNLTDVDRPINLTFDLSGFDLDVENEFSYFEHFNSTGDGAEINDSLSFNIDAPMGVFDDFVTNNTRWVRGANECNLDYVSTGLRFKCPNDPGGELTYSDATGDIRNSSKIELVLFLPIFPSTFRLFATDGTSSVQIATISNPPQSEVFFMTLTKISNDYRTWNCVDNGTQSLCSGSFDMFSLDFNEQISLKFKLTGGDSFNNFILRNINWSGPRLERYANGTYRSESNVTSCVQNTTTGVKRATLTVFDNAPTNTKISYYMSNDNGTTFENVTSNVLHVFDSVGSEGSNTCWKAKLESTVNITSSWISKLEVIVVKATAENVTVDLGNDGIDEVVSTLPLNSSNSPLTVNLTPVAGQLNTIKISTATAGQIMVDNFKLNASINPIELDKAEFEDCFNCTIDFEFSGDTLTIDGLEFDFLGSKNYTATTRFGTLSTSLLIQIFYSDFNLSLPDTFDFYDVFPSSASSKNVTPEGQNAITPVWTVTNLGYDEESDIYIKTNGTLASCFNVTYSNNSFKREIVFNESFVWINGTAVQLANTNLESGTQIVFNQTDGVEVGNRNYTIDIIGGTILFLKNVEFVPPKTILMFKVSFINVRLRMPGVVMFVKACW